MLGPSAWPRARRRRPPPRGSVAGGDCRRPAPAPAEGQAPLRPPPRPHPLLAAPPPLRRGRGAAGGDVVPPRLAEPRDPGAGPEEHPARQGAQPVPAGLDLREEPAAADRSPSPARSRWTPPPDQFAAQRRAHPRGGRRWSATSGGTSHFVLRERRGRPRVAARAPACSSTSPPSSSCCRRASCAGCRASRWSATP